MALGAECEIRSSALPGDGVPGVGQDDRDQQRSAGVVKRHMGADGPADLMIINYA